MTNDARLTEIAKYVEAYKKPGYKMGSKRKDLVEFILRKYRSENHMLEYLDIGCGRAESLELASAYGYKSVRGYEVVDSLLADNLVLPFKGIHAIPEKDNSWELVTAFDVFEHLLEADIVPAIHELVRVASRAVVLTVASFPHGDYHITLKDPSWWQRAILDATLDRVKRVITAPGYHLYTTVFEIWV